MDLQIPTTQPQSPDNTSQSRVRTNLAASVKMAFQVTMDITNLLTRLAALTLLVTFIDCDQLDRLASRIDSVATTVAGEKWISILIMAATFIIIVRFLTAEAPKQPD